MLVVGCPFLLDEGVQQGQSVGRGFVGWCVDLESMIGGVGLEPDLEVHG